MIYLGVDRDSGLIYQGSNMFGACAVWPSPIVTPASLVNADEPKIKFAKIDSFSYSDILFREDAFDPISRIRRGRFYERTNNASSDNWWVIIAPPVQAFSSEIDSRQPHLARKTATTFSPYAVSAKVAEMSGGQLLVSLGTERASTLWTIISFETMHAGEELVTLKARQSFGALPEIYWENLPDDTGLLKEKIESLLNDIYRAGPESVVDRAREAATAILSAYLQSEGIPEASGKDLGALTELLDKLNGKNGQRIIRCAAEIPQRLHSRAKHAEKEKRDNLRPIREQDAELAVQCIGVMLCDLGWARWS